MDKPAKTDTYTRVQLSPEVHARIQHACAIRGDTAPTFIAALVDDYFFKRKIKFTYTAPPPPRVVVPVVPYEDFGDQNWVSRGDGTMGPGEGVLDETYYAACRSGALIPPDDVGALFTYYEDTVPVLGYRRQKASPADFTTRSWQARSHQVGWDLRFKSGHCTKAERDAGFALSQAYKQANEDEHYGAPEAPHAPSARYTGPSMLEELFGSDDEAA